MFQSHLDEPSVMTMTSGLGQEPAGEAGSRDVTIPQAAGGISKYQSVITIVLIAVAAYMVLKALKAKKAVPAITG